MTTLTYKSKCELSDDNKAIINKINISHDKEFLNYYDKHRFEQKVRMYIQDIGSNDSIVDKVNDIIIKIIETVLDESNQESAIIWIRSKVNRINSFRWHQDGRYFKPYDDKPVYKFVMALIGESTPMVLDTNTIDKFNDAHTKFFDIIRYLQNQMTVSSKLYMCLQDEYQSKYTEIINDNYVQSPPMEGIYFLNSIDGDTRNGVIHSEPLKEYDRLFLAILPYSKEKCKMWIDAQINRNN